MKKMKNNTKTENTKKKIEINKKEMKTKVDKKKKNNCVSCQLGASYYTTH
jgi:hypothetical protein